MCPAASRAAGSANHRSLQTERLLSRGPLSTAELLAALKVSQPSLSRTIQSIPGSVMFRVRGVRTPRYGLLRALPASTPAAQNIYRVGPDGSVAPAGRLFMLQGGGTFVDDEQGGRCFDGLPPSMAFAAPSGFLGRQVAQAVAHDLKAPSNIRDWSDDHRVAYLFRFGHDPSGDLLFGDDALALEMSRRSHHKPIAPRNRLAAYRAMTDSMLAGPSGSSAGGEQPKFLASTQTHGPVIVKFARQGTRMGELLRLEACALQTLSVAGIPAAQAQLLEGEGHVFLEVVRFDRCGAHGRLGMISAAAVDDEHFGRRDSWSAFARACLEARLLKPAQVQQVHVLAAFGELIGNTDRHFDNLSLMLDGRGRVQGVAPAYDILPMMYAPIGAGLDPPLRPVQPRLGDIGSPSGVWALAGKAAQAFWTRAAHDDKLRLSKPMRAVAQRNLEVVQAFTQHLVASS